MSKNAKQISNMYEQFPPYTEQVLYSVSTNGVATILLNRPKVLNSLSYEMVISMKNRLEEWEKNDSIKLIVIKGAGEKGLCAGGDIKALYSCQDNEDELHTARAFFSTEYELDQLIYLYPKPIIASLDGIVMGGGVGLTAGATYKIVTERTKWAMPEMNIAFFPDVGAAFFLNKLPGHIGRYLALTASVITGDDVFSINAANAFMNLNKLNEFLNHLETIDWNQVDTTPTLERLISDYHQEPRDSHTFATLQPRIDHHFQYETVEEIIHSLEEDDSAFAKKTREALSSKSPVSLKVTLMQLVEGKDQDMKACFDTDLTLAMNFMKHPDFFEGVRTVLIDKGQSPNFQYTKLQEVSDDLVNRFFQPR